MKLNRRRAADGLQLSTPGMIDIVFLLLIFFLVNSSFRPSERQIASQLTDATATSATAEQDPLSIKIVAQETSFVYQVGARTFQTDSELQTWLQQWPAKSQTVLVFTPALAPVELSIAALNATRQAGFESVSYVPSAD